MHLFRGRGGGRHSHAYSEYCILRKMKSPTVEVQENISLGGKFLFFFEITSEQCFDSFISREIKQRAVKQLDEPRFQIHDYIESEKRRSNCCTFL